MISYLLVPTLFFAFSLLMIHHIIKTWKSENKSNYKKINEIMYVLLTISFGLYYPLIILKFGGTYSGIIFASAVDDFIFFGNVFIVGVIACVLLWAFSAKIRTIRNPDLLKEQNNYEYFCKKFLEKYQKKNHYKRKITHVLPVIVVALSILIFYFFRFLIGEAWVNYAIFVIIIIGIDFALTFIIEDLIRLFDFSWMPPNAIKMCCAGLTPEELDSFSSTSVMVFSFGPFAFFTLPVLVIVLLITSIADAMASIIGTLASDKKHIFPKDSKKTIEGYIGGFFSTFMCVFFGAYVSNSLGLSSWSVALTLIIAVILSITFFLIDIITSKIRLQDNYLNPLIIGFVLLLALSTMNINFF